MSKVFIALQQNEETRQIIEAIQADNDDVTIDHQPAMIRAEREGQLVVKRETIEEIMGRSFDLQELHINLITLAGNVDEDEDQFTLTRTV